MEVPYPVYHLPEPNVYSLNGSELIIILCPLPLPIVLFCCVWLVANNWKLYYRAFLAHFILIFEQKKAQADIKPNSVPLTKTW